MTTEQINTELIEAVKKRYSNPSALLKFLMDTLCLGKEAVYRRLRGEVSFSLSDAARIAEKLNISIDQEILKFKRENIPTFELRTNTSVFENDCYFYQQKIIEEHEELYNNQEEKPLTIVSATNTVPHIMLFPYKFLSKFRILRWRYQMGRNAFASKLSDITLSSDLFYRQKVLFEKNALVENSTFIFSRYIFMTFIDEITFFYNLNTISPEEIIEIKKELHSMLNHLETIAINGITHKNKIIWLYLSNINIEAVCSYIKAEDLEFATQGIYELDSILTTNPKACKAHKLWIESYRKYSTLISVSGEKERSLFFAKQREYIELL